MIRPNQVLSLIVVGVALAGAGVWLASRHGSDTDATGPVLPLKQGDLNAVTRLRIFKGDGSQVTLTRDATHWLVAERGYPADTGQVRKLLLDLSALQVEEQKTSDPALYSKLGVEDPKGAQTASTGVDIDLNGKTLALIVGKTSGTGSAYVRVVGAAQSLLASPQLTPDADPRHWLDRSLVDIAADQVKEVDVKAASGPEYAVKRAAGSAAGDYAVSPLPKGRELADPGAGATQAGALAGLQLDDVRKIGTIAPVAQATFRTGDGLIITLAGIQDGETRYITATASASTPGTQQRARDLNARLGGWQFELPGYRYDTLFRPLEQLLKPLPAPKPAAAAKPAHSPLNPGKVTRQQSH
ncbi:MAG TPA: DUF4340 domain-containing protein [Steroidobacteraceae bacterium]|nr:DUF4340 domain-containing protein [Steroidobacteraceae bacterium]